MDAAPSPSTSGLFAEVLQAFQVEGDVLRVEPWGAGHIHDTWRVTSADGTSSRRTIVQRVNASVFPDPRGVSASILRVTRHLRARLRERGAGDLERRVLRVLTTRAGEACLRRDDGSWWRGFPFVEGAVSHDVAPSSATAAEASRAFAAFQRDLEDLPPPRLPETLPEFHDTPKRLAALADAARRDPVGRAAQVAREIDDALGREALARRLTDARAAGSIPERVTHNDTKINNVLFDEVTGRALCVIDLDTVMPGIGLYDVGDLVRTTCSRAAEDEPDARRVHAEPGRVQAVLHAYLDVMGERLTEAERELLPLAGAVVTFEVAVRFLTDHLEGDTYFRTARPDHNLERARAQLALLRSLESFTGRR